MNSRARASGLPAAIATLLLVAVALLPGRAAPTTAPVSAVDATVVVEMRR